MPPFPLFLFPLPKPFLSFTFPHFLAIPNNLLPPQNLHTETMDSGAAESRVKEVRVENLQAAPAGKSELFLRVLGFLLTLVAAIVVGVDKQTKRVPVSISDDLPPLELPVTAKWQHLSAAVYFLAANIIVCSYGFLSLFLISLTNKTRNNSSLLLLVTICDVVSVALLFSGAGAAAAVGLIGYQGNSHVLWNKVCNVFGRFCDQLTAAVALSLVGGLAFMLLVVMAAVGLHKRLN